MSTLVSWVPDAPAAAPLSFEELAAVALHDVVVVVVPATRALPATARDWPVRFVVGRRPADAKHHVLCGRAFDVEAALSDGPPPLYVVTDSDAAVLGGVMNASVGARALDDDGDWERAVAAVCSRHVRSAPWLILDHARRAPDARAPAARCSGRPTRGTPPPATRRPRPSR